MGVAKIIFLDICGVLRPSLYTDFLYNMWKLSGHEIRSCDEFGQLFYQPCIDNLKHIIDKTGAKIVLSSDWKKEGMIKMRDMWENYKRHACVRMRNERNGDRGVACRE
jgi:hypothetical protein